LVILALRDCSLRVPLFRNATVTILVDSAFRKLLTEELSVKENV